LALFALPTLLIAEKVIDTEYFSRSEAVLHDSLQKSEERIAVTEKCDQTLQRLFHDKGIALDNILFLVHHNGDPETCESASFDFQAFHSSLATMDTCEDMNKFEVESFLTRYLAKTLKGCSPSDEKGGGFLSFCDMGHDRTPILLDHNELIRVPESDTLPCRFHTREGVRIQSLQQLAELARDSQACENEEETCQDRVELHLYAVPAGRVFMFAPHHVGERFELPHVSNDSGEPVSLEVLSVSPRVFEIYNFFSKEESQKLVEKALAETEDSHRIKRSTTGTKEYSIYNKRTSENGFDTHGETALKVKRRCLSTLGFDEYIEGHTDGLQILRYNTTTAYIPHMDYMTERGTKERHDYASARKGGNRYATILLYMTDMEEGDGGETVFPNAWPPEQSDEEHVDIKQAIEDLRASGDAATLKEGSWEEKMAAECRTRLAVRPRAGRAVLFYSQHPDGREDKDSRHGGCPVLADGKAKWAANLWAWNTPREGYEGSPVKEEFAKTDDQEDDRTPKQKKATFRNSGENPKFKDAELFWDSKQSWGKLGHGDAERVAYTYEGHKWTLMVDGEFVRTWIIGPEPEQTFVI
jgi:hypothetical protein